jgi:hypothetical protein
LISFFVDCVGRPGVRDVARSYSARRCWRPYFPAVGRCFSSTRFTDSALSVTLRMGSCVKLPPCPTKKCFSPASSASGQIFEFVEERRSSEKMSSCRVVVVSVVFSCLRVVVPGDR